MNKVLFIISTEGGGTQRVVSLLNYLSKNGYKIKICIINESEIKYNLTKKVKNRIERKQKNFFDFIFKIYRDFSY